MRSCLPLPAKWSNCQGSFKLAGRRQLIDSYVVLTIGRTSLAFSTFEDGVILVLGNINGALVECIRLCHLFEGRDIRSTADFNRPTPERVIWALVFLVIGCWSCAFLAFKLAEITLSKSIPDPAPADVIVPLSSFLIRRKRLIFRCQTANQPFGLAPASCTKQLDTFVDCDEFFAGDLTDHRSGISIHYLDNYLLQLFFHAEVHGPALLSNKTCKFCVPVFDVQRYSAVPTGPALAFLCCSPLCVSSIATRK